MGAADQMLPVRTAMLSALKKDSGVTAYVPAASLYPGTVPAGRTFPFGRFGTIVAAPFLASCLDSTTLRVSWQAFSQDVTDSSGAVIRTAEDNIILIGSVVKQALDGATLTLPDGMKVRIIWLQTSPTRDPTEASAWMTTLTFSAEVAG